MDKPGWRNWQTRRTQNPVLVREWEFDPPSGHHRFTAYRQVWQGAFPSSGGDQIVREAESNLRHMSSVDMSEWVTYSLSLKSDEEVSMS